jgi:hypothetical protein
MTKQLEKLEQQAEKRKSGMPLFPPLIKTYFHGMG